MQHLDEGTIHAWLDGALDDAERSRVEAHVAECATCAAAVAEARGLVAGAARVVGALDYRAAGGGRREAGGGRRAAGLANRDSGLGWRGVRFTRWAAAAAVVVVAAGTALVMREQHREGREAAAFERESVQRVSGAPGPNAALPAPSLPPAVVPVLPKETRAPTASAARPKSVVTAGARSTATQPTGAQPTAAPEPRIARAEQVQSSIVPGAVAGNEAKVAGGVAKAAAERATADVAARASENRSAAPAPAPTPFAAEQRRAVAAGVVAGIPRVAARAMDVAGCYEVAGPPSTTELIESAGVPRPLILDTTALMGDASRARAVRAAGTGGRGPVRMNGASWSLADSGTVTVILSPTGAPVLELRPREGLLVGSLRDGPRVIPVTLAPVVCPR